ncbi:MAG: molybdenum cofactor biosynthesis protein MoaB [Caldilineaceae bacterium]|nr:molybdenum cofactor biosynthesis protein MoaB [Caldilineaceae bacterium]MBP8106298.1 molybdenum cofactor biosynthesis protein MoaB [Caldilineaceae bacterium]MBP8125732.1 molybdenum cofactor biosynthesis protein MoaB [Caldilineaceae bacterium]MBP9071146.1 molybdenum cofactor biosynthesis protein MoaB [Caldilineaceae bacterium]
MVSAEEHRGLAESQGSVPVAIVTVSDTRTTETDKSGQTIRALCEEAGHTIVDYRIVKDEPDQVQQVLDDFTGGEARIIIFNGGTGISQRDRTYDVISRNLEKTLSGFGELFRMLSYEEIGSAAMFSRATAGTYRGKLIVSTPGSTGAVKLAMQKLILPEMQHLAWELLR